MVEKPADQIPGSSGNDRVSSSQNDTIYFVGQPLDVWTYLQDPANIVDDTIVIFSLEAPTPWGNTMCFAGQYLEVFSTVYPDIVLPS